MNSFLPNIRWLTLPSENCGQDWMTKSLEIDSILTGEGMDLAEESVYLLFSNSPEEILEGKGHCLIARPVIGPKKSLSEPFRLVDWVAAPVLKETVSGVTLEDILVQSQEVRAKATESLEKPFFLSVRRELNPDLKLSIEVIFHQ